MTDIQSIQSNPEETALERPYEFIVDGYKFRVNPLSMYDYYETERHIHRTLAALYYYGISLDKGLQQLLNIKEDTLNALERAKTIIDVLCAIIEPIKLRTKIKILARYNLGVTPRKWRLTLAGWFERRLSLPQIAELIEYIMVFCSTVKKKIYRILQEGITNVSTSNRISSQTLSASIEGDWSPGYRSLGQELLDLN